MNNLTPRLVTIIVIYLMLNLIFQSYKNMETDERIHKLEQQLRIQSK